MLPPGYIQAVHDRLSVSHQLAVRWQVYLASEQTGNSLATPSCFFKVKSPSEPTGELVSGICDETGRQDVTELVDRVRERCFDTLGSTPHVVALTLHPAIVDVTVSQEQAVATMCGPDKLRRRAQNAWRNYHTLIEMAKWRHMEGAKQRRGGVGLFVEVTNRDRAAGSAAELGLGLARFELATALKPPDGRTKPPDDRIITKAFNMFDADKSGCIDRDEMKKVCKQIGVPMTDEDINTAMEEIDEDGSGELDKKEFKQWFKSLSQSSDGKGSKLEQIKIRSILAGSTMASLSRRVQTLADPAESVTGEIALGSLLTAYGLETTPSKTKPHGTGNNGPQTFSIAAHGSRSGGSTVDATQLAVPPSAWLGEDDKPDPEAMRLTSCSLADGLTAYLGLNCGYQKVPGSGALRRGLKRELWKRFVTEYSVAGVQVRPPDKHPQIPAVVHAVLTACACLLCDRPLGGQAGLVHSRSGKELLSYSDAWSRPEYEEATEASRQD